MSVVRKRHARGAFKLQFRQLPNIVCFLPNIVCFFAEYRLLL
jgi:hypothetical protein